jgi:uncharacterized protein
MANYDPSAPQQWGYQQTATVSQAQLDAGLRSYMLGVYNYMMIGLVITALASLGLYMLSVTTDPALTAGVLKGGLRLTAFGKMLYTSWVKYVVMFSPLVVLLIMSFRAEKLSPTSAQVMFYVYAALIGASMSSIMLVYTHGSIVRVFFITAAAFGALSLFGYTTKKDLSAMGTFLLIGLFGLMIASLANIFFKSDMMQFIISVVGVLIFAGLTAWDTQRLKSDYVHEYAYADAATAQKSAIFGALSLYMNFVNMFQFLLSLLGSKD